MGFLDRLINFDRDGKVELTKPDIEVNDNYNNREVNLFSGINTENQDLSKPFIGDYSRSGSFYSPFGINNLFPNIINELYVSSPMSSACMNFKTWSIIGDGYNLDEYDRLDVDKKIDWKFFVRKSKFKHSISKITKDWIKHGRSIVILHYDKDLKKYDHFRVVDPSNIRNNKATIFNDASIYYYSDNYELGAPNRTMTAYSVGNVDEWQILEIKNIVGGEYTYGLPDYMSSNNWASVSAGLSLLHKSALENGIQPSVIFSYPYIMTDEEDKRWNQGMRSTMKGTQNYNRAMKLESNGIDQKPDVEVVKTTDNHKLFEQTSKEQKEEIAISHNINPALMGVRIAGSLGANEEIEFSAKQFEKIWLNSNRVVVEDFINDIISICDFNINFNFNKTEIKTFDIEKNNDL